MKRAARFLMIAGLAGFAAGRAVAQSSSTPPGGTGTSSTATAPTSRGPMPSGNGTGTSLPGSGSGGIFLSGRVIVDDGSPLPGNITIQQVCAGSTRTVAYADSAGGFSFQWGRQAASVMADASEPGSGRNVPSSTGSSSGGASGGRSPGSSNPFAIGQSSGPQMLGCELRAQASGYGSDSVTIGNRTAMDGPSVGMLVLHRLSGAEGTSVSATSYRAPKDAQKAYERGIAALRKNKPDEAAKDFEKAVARYPDYADAWTNLGKVRLMRKAIEPAREAFLRAVAADPKLAAAYMELGFLAAREKNWNAAGEYLDKAMKLDPVEFPGAWYVDAVANFNLKNFDAAEKGARRTMKLDVKHTMPRAQYLLALSLIELHEYAEGLIELKGYLQVNPNTPDFAAVKDQSDRLENFLREPQPEANAAAPAAQGRN